MKLNARHQGNRKQTRKKPGRNDSALFLKGLFKENRFAQRFFLARANPPKNSNAKLQGLPGQSNCLS
jgi:hypothetical protein